MAANNIQITVTSKNKTGPGFAEALKEADGFGAKMGVIFSRISDQAGQKLAGIGKTAGVGAGLFAAVGAALSLAAPIGAAGIAMAAFGAIAIPVLSKIQTAHTQLAAAQLQYNKATTASGRAAALQAETRATAGLTDAQKGLMGQVSGLQQSWGKLQNQMTPVVVTVAALGIKLGQTLMPVIQKLAPAGAKVISDFLGPLTKLLNSPVGVQFFAAVAKFAVQAGALIGPQVIRLLGVLMVLFMQLMPAGMKILQALLPVIVTLVGDLAPVIVVFANFVAWMLRWLSVNHLLIPAIGLTAAAMLALSIAMDSNPVSLIIVGIALLAATMMHAWKSSQTFRDILTATFSDVGRFWMIEARIVLDGLHNMADVFLTVAGIIVDGAAKAFGWVPGVGPKLKSAAKAFDGFRNDVNNTFNAAQAKIAQWKDSLARLPKEVRLKGEISDLQAKVDAARAKLRTVPASQRSRLQGNINDLLNKIAEARAALARLQGDTTTLYINAVHRDVYTSGGQTYQQFHASGGIIGAAGGGPRSRMTMVGEHGRELVSLPPGSMVHSNPDTERMLASGGGGGVVAVFQNQGVIGSQMELENWLTRSLDSLRRKGRLPSGV